MVELRQAIHDNQLVLLYQPKVNLHENRVSGFEALVRWQHPRLGLLPPCTILTQGLITDHEGSYRNTIQAPVTCPVTDQS